jgi:Flp pilus assembly pilin Flp
MIKELSSPQRRTLRELRKNESGVALIEFALGLPIMMTLLVSGTEITNYSIVTTQVSQLALQVADNASRIGEGLPLNKKEITETQINDLLMGAGIHAGRLDIYGTYQEYSNGVPTTKPRGRIIISSSEMMAKALPSDPDKYEIKWQRCSGAAITYASHFGIVTKPSGTNMNGIGPVGRQVKAPSGVPILFSEVHYRYNPLFLSANALMGYRDIDVIGAMMVRDDRDVASIKNTAGAPVSGCYLNKAAVPQPGETYN